MKEMRDYRNVSLGGREMRVFNNFILDLGVEDIPFNIGRRYMWYYIVFWYLPSLCTGSGF